MRTAIEKNARTKYLGRGEILWNKRRIRLRGKDLLAIQGTKIGALVNVDITVSAQLGSDPRATVAMSRRGKRDISD